jgi:glycerophosphoryl diester phosphodiesterase
MTTIVAHRGASRLARENTLDAFTAAVALGADMVELDIRKCGDGTLVVFNDPWLVRATRSTPIAGLTFGELNKRSKKQGFSIPAMEDAFKTLSGKTMLDIELKEPGYEAAVIACARRYFDSDKFVLTSFNPQIIAAVKAIDPALNTGFILATPEGLALAGDSPAEVLAPGKGLYAAHRNFFAKAHTQGKRIAVWTVDSRELIARLLADPLVDAIITNYPDRALGLRKRLENEANPRGAVPFRKI